MWGGVKPCIIAVCGHELDFIRPFRFARKIQESVIPNGINLTRINQCETRSRHSPVTFLAFGGRNVQKRTDLLIRAAANLVGKDNRLHIIIVGSNATKRDLEEKCGQLPDWVEIIEPREDINSIFEMADCFVSTSVHETFSYAIAEATAFGLPVIQSDIAGTLWNAANPSTFMFKSEDVDDLTGAMNAFLQTSPTLLNEKCEETSRRNRQKYSLDTWTEKIIEFFQTIP